jgi:ElaA protein
MTPESNAAAAPVRWQWARFDELAPREAYAALALRQRVFVVEQACVFQDADGHDFDAWHLLGWANAGGDVTLPAGEWIVDGAGGRRVLVACARVFAPGALHDGAASIGRVVTAPEARGGGLGRALMVEALRRTFDGWPGAEVRLAAQQRLERFYESFGFESRDEAPYVEDGIAHVMMVRARD